MHKAQRKGKSDWAKGIIAAISDGLTAYMTLQARTGLSPAYSEYLLYDPVVRITKHNGWIPISEFAVETHKRKGDKKRIDFLLVNKKNKRQALAIELKWFVSSSKKVKIEGDLEKLSNYKSEKAKAKVRRFLLLAGTHAVRPNGKAAKRPWPKLTPEMDQPYFYHTIYRANRTRYGVTVFEITPK
jgi:hypothetical protein